MLPFEGFNEADVREEVISPLLHRLGYKAGSENNIIRELSLRYPRQYLGRKNPRRDPPLRGKADYILEAKRRVRWVIDAKAPGVPIDDEAIEQTFTYANHPEVRAVYFAICNGHALMVFRTTAGPTEPPVLSVDCADFEQISNLLSPDALDRGFKDVPVDTKPPIAPGLRSVARVTNGVIRYEQCNLDLPHFRELIVTLSDGTVQRGENGALIAFLRATVPFNSLQRLNERLGLDEFEMTSSDSKLSLDTTVPTTFRYQKRLILPGGEEVFDLLTWQSVKLPANVVADVTATAWGAYRDKEFSGTFTSQYLQFGVKIELSGSFHIHLA